MMDESNSNVGRVIPAPSEFTYRRIEYLIGTRITVIILLRALRAATESYHLDCGEPRCLRRFPDSFALRRSLGGDRGPALMR